MSDSALSLRRVVVGPIGTNCYILSLPERDDCVIIDPGAEADRIRSALQGKRLAAILLTHGHFDHIGAVDDLMKDGPRLFVHEADRDYLTSPELNGSWLIDAVTVCHAEPELIHDGSELELAGIHFRVLHTPGHTPGCVCYEVGSELFTGDTLFEHGYGRTDLPGGSMTALRSSLRRIYPMQADHRIYGGHG